MAPSKEVAGTRRPLLAGLDLRSKMLQPPLLVPVSSRWGWRGWQEMLLACDLSSRWKVATGSTPTLVSTLTTLPWLPRVIRNVLAESWKMRVP